MERITARLSRHPIIGLDTAVFIYHVEAHPRYLPLTHALLVAVEAGRHTAVTSTLTLMELTVRPWQQSQPEIAREYETLLVHFPHLILADIDRRIARHAAQLRARFRLRAADALQVATARIHGATAFVTSDRELTRLSPALDILVLDDLISSHRDAPERQNAD